MVFWGRHRKSLWQKKLCCHLSQVKPYFAWTITAVVTGDGDLTRFNKIAIQGTPQMAVDKEAICLSRVYSYYPKCNFPLFYV